MSATIEHPRVRDRAYDCLDSLTAAGFDDFEITIPYSDERPYRIFLFHCGDGRWRASVEDNLADRLEVAEGEGSSPGEALWNLGNEHLGTAEGWAGDAAILAPRIMLLASILWADATRKTAEEDAARDELLDRTKIEAW